MIMNNMKKLSGFVAAVPVLVLPIITFAAEGLAGSDTTGGEIGALMTHILQFIDNYVIPFILAVGFVLFVCGVFQYFIRASDEAKETGKNLIIYAIIGYVVILAFWGIIGVLTNGIGLQQTLDKNTLPQSNIISPN
jgi:Type IV secretion system pilin